MHEDTYICIYTCLRVYIVVRDFKCVLRYRFHMTPVPVLMLAYTIERAKEIQASCFFPTGRTYITMAVMFFFQQAEHTSQWPSHAG